jgi:hypothetical protein
VRDTLHAAFQDAFKSAAALPAAFAASRDAIVAWTPTGWLRMHVTKNAIRTVRRELDALLAQTERSMVAEEEARVCELEAAVVHADAALERVCALTQAFFKGSVRLAEIEAVVKAQVSATNDLLERCAARKRSALQLEFPLLSCGRDADRDAAFPSLFVQYAAALDAELCTLDGQERFFNAFRVQRSHSSEEPEPEAWKSLRTSRMFWTRRALTSWEVVSHVAHCGDVDALLPSLPPFTVEVEGGMSREHVRERTPEDVLVLMALRQLHTHYVWCYGNTFLRAFVPFVSLLKAFFRVYVPSTPHESAQNAAMRVLAARVFLPPVLASARARAATDDKLFDARMRCLSEEQRRRGCRED